jgi:hypothetical protein
LLWEQEVGGSNPLAPTNLRFKGSRFRSSGFKGLEILGIDVGSQVSTFWDAAPGYLTFSAAI